MGIHVFYDNYEEVELWGKDLYSHLSYIYSRSARYCVVFISRHYAAKVWTNHERKAAQARALQENREYVLPVRFDDTKIEGILPTVGYLSLSRYSPKELADRIVAKLGPRKVKQQFPAIPDRLFKSMGIPDDDGEQRQRVGRVSYSFYEAMGRMSRRERQTIGGVFSFGCPAELPELMHISLDFLHRMIGIPKAELLELLSGLRSLGFTVKTRQPIHEPEEGELAADDLDLTVHFFTIYDPDDTATLIAYEAAQSAADHFCADHGLEMLVNLDFGHLSLSHNGPVVLDCLEEPDESAKES